MKEAIFPGCSLMQSAKDYYHSTKIILKYLDKNIEELPEWECCGATILPSISKRDFEEANRMNIKRARPLKIEKLISPCSSYYRCQTIRLFGKENFWNFFFNGRDN